MVSTAFDEDTDSGSINLEELEELAASVGVPTAPSFDQGDKPKSIGDELKNLGKASIPKTRVNKKNFESVVNNLKESVESANDTIVTLKELATKENKSHMDSWDKVNRQVTQLFSYGTKTMKTAVKVAENNKSLAEKLRDMKEEVKRLKEVNKKCADDLKEVKKEKEELKKEKKGLMDNINALNKAAEETQKTINRHVKTIDTMEKHMLKKGGAAKDDDLDEELKRTKAKNDAKLEADYQKKYMELNFKEMEQRAKVDAKNNRIFGSFGGGGMGMMGMMGGGMMGGGMMGGIQGSWNNRMDMVRLYLLLLLLYYLY